MKSNNEIRLENLHRLIKEAGTQEQLSEVSGVSRIYLNQIKKQRPDPSTGKTRNVGDALARKLEKGMGKPEGWMDKDHSDADHIHSATQQQFSWPFENISYEKVKNLSPRDLIRLEAGIEIAAKDLGLDIVETSNPAKSEVA